MCTIMSFTGSAPDFESFNRWNFAFWVCSPCWFRSCGISLHLFPMLQWMGGSRRKVYAVSIHISTLNLCYNLRFTTLNLGKQYDFDCFVLQFCSWRLMVGIQTLEWSLRRAVFLTICNMLLTFGYVWVVLRSACLAWLWNEQSRKSTQSR